MVSVYLHASETDPHAFQGTGPYLGTTVTTTGTWDYDCDGHLTFNFKREFAREYGDEFYAGRLEGDTLVGTIGWDDNTSTHENLFILKRTPAAIMCYHPAPKEFRENKARALWKFATQAVRARVLRERYSWEHFARRRDLRNIFIATEFRMYHYGRSLSDDELALRRDMRQGLTMIDAIFISSIFDYQLRMVPAHEYAFHISQRAICSHMLH